MKLNVHYFKDSREVYSFDTGDIVVSEREDCDTIQTEVDDAMLIALRAGHCEVVDKELVHKPDEETTRLRLASLLADVNAAIYSELLATDQYVNMPEDRPRKGLAAYEWKPYREGLRKLSKLSGPVEMILSWPLRPDMQDPIASLRSRVTTHKEN